MISYICSFFLLDANLAKKFQLSKKYSSNMQRFSKSYKWEVALWLSSIMRDIVD